MRDTTGTRTASSVPPDTLAERCEQRFVAYWAAQISKLLVLRMGNGRGPGVGRDAPPAEQHPALAGASAGELRVLVRRIQGGR